MTLNKAREQQKKQIVTQLLYNLYKEDWVKTHISVERENQIFQNYHEFVNKSKQPSLLFEEYVNEFGFLGELYCCYEEFLENEYQDKDYMAYLLEQSSHLDFLNEYDNSMNEISRI